MSKDIAQVAKWEIEAYYAETGFKAWDCARLYKLCRRLNCLPYEMAALLRIELHNWNAFITCDKFSGPVSLHFEIIDRWLDGLEGKPRLPVLPMDLIMKKDP